MSVERFSAARPEVPPLDEQVNLSADDVATRLKRVSTADLEQEELQETLAACMNDSLIKKWAMRIGGLATLLAAMHALPGKHSREAHARTVEPTRTERVLETRKAKLPEIENVMESTDTTKSTASAETAAQAPSYDILLEYGDVPIVKLDAKTSAGAQIERLQKKYGGTILVTNYDEMRSRYPEIVTYQTVRRSADVPNSESGEYEERHDLGYSVDTLVDAYHASKNDDVRHKIRNQAENLLQEIRRAKAGDAFKPLEAKLRSIS